LETDRAIVTAEAGTTRDLIAEPMDWEGVPVRLLDTAGIRAPGVEAERLGIQKSWEAAADANLVLALFDRSQPLTAEDEALLGQLERWPRHLLLANKCDLPPAAWPGSTPAMVAVSARTGAGLDQLRGAVREQVAPDLAEAGEFITNARHAQHLATAAAHLTQAEAAAVAGLPHEVVLVDLYDGLHQLDAITGQTTVEDILGVIFSTFCIGK
jgi:tRNA modification GTPase